jgi:hypothetical protein
MKQLGFLVLLYTFLSMNSLKAQEPNLFLVDPIELRTFLGESVERIEIQKRSPAGTNLKDDIEATRLVEFLGDSLCLDILIADDNIADTSFYKFDECGKLKEKYSRSSKCYYKNSYTKCKLIRKEVNEMEIVFSSLRKERYISRYSYDKLGKLVKETVLNFDDTSVIDRMVEHTYIGAYRDSVNEYYFENGVKLRNRSTKNFYSNGLDSTHFYNFKFDINDKILYKYNQSMKIVELNSLSLGNYKYLYDANNRLIAMLEESSQKMYKINFR